MQEAIFGSSHSGAVPVYLEVEVTTKLKVYGSLTRQVWHQDLPGIDSLVDPWPAGAFSRAPNSGLCCTLLHECGHQDFGVCVEAEIFYSRLCRF